MGSYHVSSRRNRDSITAYGLDWRLMGAASGIAGSRAPEVAGTFLCTTLEEARYFVELNSTGGPVDIWQVDDVDHGDLVDAGSGYLYLPATVEPHRIRLLDPDPR